MNYKNVRLLGNLANADTPFLEQTYLDHYFTELARLTPDIFSTYSFEVISQNLIHGTPPELSPKGKRVVLIWLSDESSTIPTSITTGYAWVLKSYFPEAEPVGNIHPFPLCGSNEVIVYDPPEFPSRKYNVLFSGNLSPNRLDFFRSFTAFRNLPPFPLRSYLLRRLYSEVLYRFKKQRAFPTAFPDSEIHFTSGFRQGFNAADFAARLADTKIALCPEGFRSFETIRHFEAMSMGCIVVAPRLPPNRFYLNSPIIQLSNWNQLSNVVNGLISHPEDQLRRHHETISWWKNVCSPAAMALYTAGLLKAG